MPIWIDADACPRPAREILFRASRKRGIELILVANSALAVPRSPLIRTICVPRGADMADHEIVSRVASGELVITADIPLAALVVEKGALALDPRGEMHTQDTVRERLSLRNFMSDLRSAGVQTGGAEAYSERDSQRFANALDRWLTQNSRSA